MGRLGSHPNIVTVFDLGDHQGQPYMVTELMEGGDVEGLIGDALITGSLRSRLSRLPKRYPQGWSPPTPKASCTAT